MLIPCPRTRRRWIYGLVAFGVMALPLSPHCRAADDAATGQASATPATPDQDVVALLDKLREQVSAGQTTAPPNDNAVETWLQITKLTASKLSPGAARALDDFVRAVHNAETAEQEAGHGTVALDLLVFADFAVAELKNRLNDGSTRSVCVINRPTAVVTVRASSTRRGTDHRCGSPAAAPRAWRDDDNDTVDPGRRPDTGSAASADRNRHATDSGSGFRAGGILP